MERSLRRLLAILFLVLLLSAVLYTPFGEGPPDLLEPQAARSGPLHVAGDDDGRPAPQLDHLETSIAKEDAAGSSTGSAASGPWTENGPQRLVAALEEQLRAKAPAGIERGAADAQQTFCRTVALEEVKVAAERLAADNTLRLRVPELRDFPSASALYRSMQAFAVLFPAAENITTSPDASAGLSCASTLMDHLFEWAIHSVGNMFRNLVHKNEGIFYVSHRRLSRSRGIGGHWRFGWFPQELVQQVAAAKHNNFTIMYLAIHDADPWTIAQDADRLSGSKRIHELLEQFPNAFLLHPSGRTDAAGRLFRTVPVPHAPSEIVHIDFAAIRVPYSERRIQKVAWRGSTTGEYQRPYSRTDRFRMVEAFQASNKDGKSDVAFSGIAQGNPATFGLGTPMDRKQIMQHRATLDVDGNSNSWEGLRWKLLAGAAVVKVRSGLGFVQWYYHQLRSGDELIETDVEHVVETAMAVVSNATLGAHLSARALSFAERHLTKDAVDRAVWDLVGNVWRYGYDLGKDWRIQRA